MLQCGHLCQKQPLIKTATFFAAKTISGLPGIVDKCSLYPLIPIAKRPRLTAISGFVFFCLIALIMPDIFSDDGTGDLLSLLKTFLLIH
jgi:hypothetical protein